MPGNRPTAKPMAATGQVLPSRRYRRDGQRAAVTVDERRLARGLGWLGIGMGLAEVVAPRTLARLLGLKDDAWHTAALRALGVREIATGLGLVTADQPAPGWVWARVAGDAMDLALLGAAMTEEGAQPARLGGTMAAVAALSAVDVLCAQALRGPAGGLKFPAARQPIALKAAVTINRPPREVYEFWRHLPNLPRFMSHLEAVSTSGGRLSHWRARGPAGVAIEWDAEITEDRPADRIAWRSLEGSDIDHAGVVHFEAGPAGQGTVVRVKLSYVPPVGRAGAALARLFGAEPGQMISDDLRILKRVLETGEATRSEAAIPTLPHAAEPPASRR